LKRALLRAGRQDIGLEVQNEETDKPRTAYLNSHELKNAKKAPSLTKQIART